MQNTLEGLRSEIQNQSARVETLLKENASILQENSVSYSLKGNQIAINVYAIPKELEEGETVFAVVKAGDRVYETDLDENHQGTIYADYAESFQTTVAIRSAQGFRQEILEERYATEILCCDTEVSWVDTEHALLNLQVKACEERLPFNVEDIVTAEFIVIDTGIVEEHSGGASGARSKTVSMAVTTDGEMTTAPLEAIQGERIKAQILNSSEDYLLLRGDFSEYAQRRDGVRYEISFYIETKDGIIFKEQFDSVASFSKSEDSSFLGDGGGRLVPVFP